MLLSRVCTAVFILSAVLSCLRGLGRGFGLGYGQEARTLGEAAPKLLVAEEQKGAGELGPKERGPLAPRALQAWRHSKQRWQLQASVWGTASLGAALGPASPLGPLNVDLQGV